MPARDIPGGDDMTGDISGDITQEALDARLEEELRRLIATRDPVPANVQAAAREVWTWRDIDAELAELSCDSLDASRTGLALVRGTALAPRLLVFEASDLTLEFEVLQDDDSRSITGRLLPPRAAEISVEHPDGAVVVVADALGRFLVDRLPGGLVRLSCRLTSPAGRLVVTTWVEI